MHRRFFALTVFLFWMTNSQMTWADADASATVALPAPSPACPSVAFGVECYPGTHEVRSGNGPDGCPLPAHCEPNDPTSTMVPTPK